MPKSNFVFFFSLIALPLVFLHCAGGSGGSDSNYSGTEADFTIPTVEGVDPSALIHKRTYFVSSDGSDSNPGTEDRPWKTIQHAADNVVSGDRVFVKPGEYEERVEIDRSGDRSNYIIFEAGPGVHMHGFELFGDYIAVVGFTVSGHAEAAIGSWLSGGFWISGSHLYLANNRIEDAYLAAFLCSWGSDSKIEKIHIYGNYIEGCHMGIVIDGNDFLVENNTIRRLKKAVGSNADCDYFRLFGNNMVIRNNILWGTKKDEIGDAHVDCFQTFNNNDGALKNVLIMNNIAIGFFSQGFMLEGDNEHFSNFIVLKNIFVNGDPSSSWVAYAGGISGVHFQNNLFCNFKVNGVVFKTEKGSNSIGTIKNNLLINNYSTYSKDSGCILDAGFNYMYRCVHGGPAEYFDYFTDEDPKVLINDTDFSDVTLEMILGPDGIAFTKDDGFFPRPESPLWEKGKDKKDIGPYDKSQANQ